MHTIANYNKNEVEQRTAAELLRGSDVLRLLAYHLPANIVNVAEHLTIALSTDHKIMVCGNGGSTSDAQHFVAEFIGRFRRERLGLPALSLATDSSVLTCLSNDYGFKQVFARQVQVLDKAEDILVAISTSGLSLNVLNAVTMASNLGITTIGLVGKDGGKLAQIVNYPLVVPDTNIAFIQQGHIAILHLLSDLVESFLEGTGSI